MLNLFCCCVVAKPSPAVLYVAESFCNFILVLENVWGCFVLYSEGIFMHLLQTFYVWSVKRVFVFNVCHLLHLLLSTWATV